MRLRTKITLISMLTCVLSLCILYGVLGAYVQEYSDRQAREFCHYNALNLAAVLDQAFDSAHDISLSVIINRPIRDYVEALDRRDPAGVLFSMKETAQNALFTITGSSQYVSSVNVSSLNGQSLHWGKQGRLTPADMERADALRGMYYWGVDESGAMQGQPFLCRLLRDEQQVSMHWGYVKIYLYADKIGQLLSSSLADAFVTNVLLDEQGSVILPLSQTGNAWDDAKTHSQIRQLAHSNWRLGTALNREYLLDVRTPLIQTMQYALLLAFATWLALSVVLSHLLTRPVRRISSAMEAIGSGKFGTHLDMRRRDEMGMLAQGLNQMSDELQRLMDEAVRNHTLFIEARLNALQSQVNPHFLYNTLDNIHWMCEMRHQKEISKMVSSLSRLFRLGLSMDKSGVWPLSREIEHVRCYMDILKIRFQNTVEFAFDVQENLEDLEVPALLLQPLVENAVQHGIHDLEHGEVRVEIRAQNGMLHYSVWDNGPADAVYINRLIQNGPERGSCRGQALNNLYQRITLRFGEDARFYCTSNAHECLFMLIFPIRRVPRQHDARRNAE